MRRRLINPARTPAKLNVTGYTILETPLYWSAEWSMLFPEASFPENLNMIWDGSSVALASLFWVILNITLAVFVLELYVTLRGTEEMLASEGLTGSPQLYAPPASEPDVRLISQFEMF